MTKNLIKAIGKHSFTKAVLLTICLSLGFAFYSCKHQQDGGQVSETKPILTSCNVDGKVLEISELMDAGKTKKEKVLVKATHSPKDAIVKYEKPLDSDGYWALSLGENTLKVVVEQGNDKKEYTIKMKRGSEKVKLPINELYISEQNVLENNQEIVEKLLGDERPEFEAADPTDIELLTTVGVSSATIAGEAASVTQKASPQGTPCWEVKKTGVTGFKASPKDIDIVLNPIDGENYEQTTVKFKLKYKELTDIQVTNYEINGKKEIELPQTFNDALMAGKEPTLKVKGMATHIKIVVDTKLEKARVNDEEISQDRIVEADTYYGKRYGFRTSIKLDGTNKKAITIELIPEDKSAVSKKKLRFFVQGNGAKEKIEPLFEHISGNKSLPQSFRDGLTDPANPPTYEVKGTKAEISILLDGYTGDFLFEKAQINGLDAQFVRDEFAGFVEYKLTKEIEGIEETTPKDFSILFKGKEGIADDVEWKFKIKGGGKLPNIPQNKIVLFTINGYGDRGKPFEEDFKNYLTDSTKKPLFELYGKKVIIKVGCYESGLLKDVDFKVGDNAKVAKTLVKDGAKWIAEYETELANVGTEYEVEVSCNPHTEKENDFSPLVYSFKLKSLDEKLSPDYSFGIDREVRPSGYKATLNAEYATLSVQIPTEDLMQKVEIGVENDLKECNIATFKTSGGTIVYQATSQVPLNTSSEKTYVIKVTPKDASQYAIVECKYHLKGTSISNTNAEFVQTEENKPDVKVNIEWNEGLEDTMYVDGYGAKKVTLTARTVSPRATVKYQFINPVSNTAIPDTEKTMANNNGIHKAEGIELYQDKPTKIKVYVVAEDAHTQDEVYGIWQYTYNKVSLLWNSDASPQLSDFLTFAYDKIEVERNKIKDGKVHLCAITLNKGFGYAMDDTDLPEEQSPFEGKEALGYYHYIYTSTVDVSKLLNGEVNEIKAHIKVKHITKKKLCMDYIVTVTLK